MIMPWGMGMNFPAARILRMGKEYQGVAPSLLDMVVNSSISIWLGLAGAIKSQINSGRNTESDPLKVIRGTLYMEYWI
jgi:hypothetical protein